ncbi:flagellar basal body P-ring protein FlgI [Psychrobium sp. 1_MG-2023]|uniref:flagellar basal body P-ring protein FlgI n=1 Tax=Psychrobium sp. 1_MG-2023 TaxID=3062624 RepID=UPI000C327E66|nr:flagellar basal body P-ring protein FlgI [Psychrobium sp. 1_MG-2023]MDP2559866.1 flagellar basal body P-ring protein FlgI [Psychrobium sp. 1_MG-2023]PKF59033.1 flagellar biosynthesis protein FlgI [Alteromonadales bacterium alter-6D02]
MKKLTLITYFILLCSLFFGCVEQAKAQRIKDLASVKGVRSNQLVGYGLVVGLPGTGEQSPFTDQSFMTMLRNFGISMPAGVKPKIKNVAAVAIHADLNAFAKPGQNIDITVSSVGSAKSLRGGTLLRTFLKGLDGNVYAVAQGSLMVSGFSASGDDGSKVIQNTPTVGRIPNGAIVEREVPNSFAQGDYITFNLHNPDFTTAQAFASTINQKFGGGVTGTTDIVEPSANDVAKAIDATSINVRAPRDVSQRIYFLSVLENLDVTPATAAAKIIVNSRTGTIVIGQQVRLKPAAITHGSLTVTIAENPAVIQPNPLANGETAVEDDTIIDVNRNDSRMFKFIPGTTLDELVQAVNLVGASPSDLMAILEALKQAGSLHGELIVI